jgi:hypothetical protein
MFAFIPVLSAQEQAEASPEELTMKQREDALVALADSMMNTMLPDDRVDFGLKFAKTLYKALQQPDSRKYPFSKLEQKIHILDAPDKSFRVFNWLVAPDDFIRRYYSIIQKEENVYPLTNYSDRLKNDLLTATLDAKHWYGAEYYRILKKETKEGSYYFLFGLNTDGTYSNKKILDVVSFSDQGPVFGAPLFVVPGQTGDNLQTQNRVIWEYKKESPFKMNFDDNKDMIIFDRLKSDINDPARKNTYVASGQFDGLKWENNQWIFVQNAIPVLRLKDGQAPVNGVMQNGK